MKTNVLTLACRGRDLETKLEESLRELNAHGDDWVREIMRARQSTGRPHAVLVHPSDLPEPTILRRVHRWIGRLL